MPATALLLHDPLDAAVSLRGNGVVAHYIVRGMLDPHSASEAVAAGVPALGQPWPLAPYTNATCRSVELGRVLSPSAAVWRAEFRAGGPWPQVRRLSTAEASIEQVQCYSAVRVPTDVPWLNLWRADTFTRQRAVHRMTEIRTGYVDPAAFHRFMGLNVGRSYRLAAQGDVPCIMLGADYRRDAGNDVEISTHFLTTSALPAINTIPGVNDLYVPDLGPLGRYVYAPPVGPLLAPQIIARSAEDDHPPGEPIPWL